MIYLIIAGIVLLIIGGLVIWALIERKGKKKAKIAEQVANIDKAKAEKRVFDIGKNVDRILDYNSKDAVVKQDLDNRIVRLRDARSKTDVKNEVAKLRAELFDICVSD